MASTSSINLVEVEELRGSVAEAEEEHAQRAQVLASAQALLGQVRAASAAGGPACRGTPAAI